MTSEPNAEQLYNKTHGEENTDSGKKNIGWREYLEINVRAQTGDEATCWDSPNRCPAQR